MIVARRAGLDASMGFTTIERTREAVVFSASEAYGLFARLIATTSLVPLRSRTACSFSSLEPSVREKRRACAACRSSSDPLERATRSHKEEAAIDMWAVLDAACSCTTRDASQASSTMRATSVLAMPSGAARVEIRSSLYDSGIALPACAMVVCIARIS